MSRMRLPALVAFSTAIVAGIALVACGGGSKPGAPPATTEPAATVSETTAPAPAPKTSGPVASDLAGLDAADAALIAGYLGWTELTEPPIAELQGLGSAHGGDKRVWASPQRDALLEGGRQRFPYPDDTVIVKEAQRGGVVTLIALMEKTGAGGTATGGWRYAEYTRTSADSPYAKVGLSQSGCAGCHENANTRQQTDWVFWALRG